TIERTEDLIRLRIDEDAHVRIAKAADALQHARHLLRVALCVAERGATFGCAIRSDDQGDLFLGCLRRERHEEERDDERVHRAPPFGSTIVVRQAPSLGPTESPSAE